MNQHIRYTNSEWNTLLTAGISPQYPPIEPFTAGAFVGWYHHPIYQWIPLYRTELTNKLRAIPVIDAPVPSDELHTRRLRSLTYNIETDSWGPTEVLPMQVIRESRLDDLMRMETLFSSKAPILYAHFITRWVAAANSLQEIHDWSIEEDFNKLSAYCWHRYQDYLAGFVALFTGELELMEEFQACANNMDGWVYYNETWTYCEYNFWNTLYMTEYVGEMT